MCHLLYFVSEVIIVMLYVRGAYYEFPLCPGRSKRDSLLGGQAAETRTPRQYKAELLRRIIAINNSDGRRSYLHLLIQQAAKINNIAAAYCFINKHRPVE